MTIITGAKTNIGVKLTSTWGTAAAASTGDKLTVDSFTYNKNASPLTVNPIGAGVEMTKAVEVGAINPTIQFGTEGQYQGPQVKLEALMMGGASITAEASGSYTCSVIYNAIRPAKYASIGFNSSSGTSLEMASGLPTELTVTGDSAPAYLKKSFTIIGDDIIEGATNTPTTLAAATLSSEKYVVLRKQDYFRLNAQAGAALSASDNVNIKSITIAYSRPLEPVAEVSGASSAANSLPRASGTPPFSCTVTVKLRGVVDNTYFAAFTAGTEYKAELGVTGDLISGSIYYKERRFFPRLKLVDYPDAPIQGPGENEMTLKFTGLVAASVPSGMLDVYPHMVWTNTSSSAPLTA